MGGGHKIKKAKVSEAEKIGLYLKKLEKSPPKCRGRRIKKILNPNYSGKMTKPSQPESRKKLSDALKDLPPMRNGVKSPNSSWFLNVSVV